jgi:mycothiol synthase
VNARVPTVREVDRGEADAVVELLNEQSQQVHGSADLSPEAIAGWFELPGVVMLVAEENGRLVGYADLQDHGDDETVWIDPRTLPSRPEAGAPLIAELERRAAARGRPVVRAAVADLEGDMRGLLEARGYRPIRHSYRMLIEPRGEQRAVDWPDGITVRVMQQGEEEAVYAAYVDAFADHWGFVAEPFDQWCRNQVESPLARLDLWFVALAGDEIAGVCLCSTHESGDRGYGWVNILGVRPAWRRRGLGEALLRHAFRSFAAEGATNVGLGVDGENTTGAVRLYERAGMRVVRRYDTYERRLDG